MTLTPMQDGAASAIKKQNKLLIVFEDDLPREKQRQMIESAGGKIDKDFRPFANLVSITVDEKVFAQSKSAIEKGFKGSIKFVEEDRQVYSLHHSTPPLGSEYQNYGSWSVAHIGSHIAHQQQKGAGVKVAVLDSGIDYTHPDLNANFAGGYNFISMNSDPLDDFGHGTFTAGIIGADDDGTGMVGVAPDSQIHALKVLDSAGIGHISDIIAALQWSVSHDIDIVSMSFGLASDSPALHDAIANAYSSGILLVAAAGNSPGKIEYPAAYSEVIAVGATDSSDSRALFSATGAGIELVAPGVAVVSTLPTNLGGPYGTDDGTSASAPHVAGVAALIKSTDESLWHSTISNGDGSWSVNELRAVLASTSKDLGATGRDLEYGYGLVDAAQATKSSISLSVTTEYDGNPITGYYTVLSQGGAVVSTAFSPVSFALTGGLEYQVAVADYGDLVFDHWMDNDSRSRERTLAIQSDIELTAAYRNVSQPLPGSPPQPSLTVTSTDSAGNAINGYYTTLAHDGATIASGFTPVTFALTSGQEYQVVVQDYGAYSFHHWLDDGDKSREKTVIVESSLMLAAVYSSNNDLPSLSAQSTVSISTIDYQGNTISGYYTTLWQNGSLVKRGFSPITFELQDNQEYQVAVADYGNYVFDRWQGNESSDRFQTVLTGQGSLANLVAIYKHSNQQQ